MGQQVNVFAAKPEGPNSIPKTHMVEELTPIGCSDLYMHTEACIHTPQITSEI